jgi:hypothetical protein
MAADGRRHCNDEKAEPRIFTDEHYCSARAPESARPFTKRLWELHLATTVIGASEVSMFIDGHPWLPLLAPCVLRSSVGMRGS